MSKSHFTRFPKKFRPSFGIYLNHFQIAKAKAHLSLTAKLMSEIGRTLATPFKVILGLSSGGSFE